VVLKNIPEQIIPPIVAGQFTGAGKNHAFGFGSYLVDEAQRFSPILPPKRCLNPFEQPRFRVETPMKSLKMTGFKEFFLSAPTIHLQGSPVVSPEDIDRQLSALPERERLSALRHLFPLNELPVEEDQSLTAASRDISGKRSLFLTRFTTRVQTEGANLVVEVGGKLRIKVPWSTINHVFLIGKPPVTTGIIYRALSDGIPVTFMDMTGRTRGNLYPEGHDMPFCTEAQQERVADESFCLEFTREIVSAKVHNSAVLLRRNGVDVPELGQILAAIGGASDIEVIRGYEGAASRVFFERFSALVESFEFVTRDYHPPHDPVNAMLSFTYSLIYNRLASLLRAGGLNPRIGLYHRQRGRHAALASDLMEELRHIGERVVLKVIHRGEVSPDEFSLKRWKGQTLCEIPRQVITLLVTRFEEVMHTEAAMYGGTDIYGYMQGMVRRFVRAIRDGVPYRALRIR
ncbi:MAG: CRISPR-associated endonuclease Cas1, partial [Nitrospirae bacterium]